MTAFQLYEYLFMTELIVAGMLFSHKFVRRKLFPARFAGALALCYLSVFGLSMTGAAGTGWQASLIFLAMFAVFCAALVLMSLFDVYFTAPYFAMFYCLYLTLAESCPPDRKEPPVISAYDDSVRSARFGKARRK